MAPVVDLTEGARAIAAAAAAAAGEGGAEQRGKALRSAKKRSRGAAGKQRSRRARDEDEDLDSDDAMLHELSEEERRDEEREEEEREAMLDFRTLELKPDYKIRPIWVLPSGKVLLEASSRFYKQAYDFLVAVAEPLSRPRFLHEYKLTSYSLYAAVSIGLTPDSIIAVLDRLSKVALPPPVSQFIRECTTNFGKAKIVLIEKRMFIESPEKSTLERLAEAPGIQAARIFDVNAPAGFGQTEMVQEEGDHLNRMTDIVIEATEEGDVNADETDEVMLLREAEAHATEAQAPEVERRPSTDGDPPASATASNSNGSSSSSTTDVKSSDRVMVYRLEIDPSHAERVRRAALEIDYPLMEEYDFRDDKSSPRLPIELKPSTEIRPYQERSLSKMFGNGRARSGIIVLPCGAGKTLTGITACCTIRKSCIVLCPGGEAADQWRRQLQHFTTVNEKKHVFTFTSKIKNEIDRTTPCILVTTYSMMAVTGAKRSRHAKEVLETIWSREWGLMLLDEVHMAPARYFRKVMTNIKAHCKLGLTATLVREDEKIKDLNFLIGPKLYEANWLDLTESGYLARVKCLEVRCPMTPEFFAEYLHEPSMNIKQLLYTMNPNKCITCDHLVRYHESLGDRVLVFCDHIVVGKFLSKLLGRDYVSGSMPLKERIAKYSHFRLSAAASTLILSKVGDVAIDLPEANVIIQMSGHFGSRRQEAQRLGRILRPKGDAKRDGGFDAYFYTLVSSDTEEPIYSTKRQQYLVDQGYAYEVSTDLCDHAKRAIVEGTSTSLPSNNLLRLLELDEQLNLLHQVLVQSRNAIRSRPGSGKAGGTTKAKTKKQATRKIDHPEDSDYDFDERSDSDADQIDDEELAANDGVVARSRRAQDPGKLPRRSSEHDDDESIDKEEDEEEDEEEEEEEEEDDDLLPVVESAPRAKRLKTDMNLLSGAGSLEYYEFQSGKKH